MPKTTPQSPMASAKTPRRHLGLRRSANRLGLIGTPTNRIQISTPQQFAKSSSSINQKPITPAAQSHLQDSHPNTAVKATPQPIECVVVPDDAVRRNCQSTGGVLRKYRLSLNKQIRDKYTRKRLNFQETAEAPTEEDTENKNCRLIDLSSKSASSQTADPNKEQSNLFNLELKEQIILLEQQIAAKQHDLQSRQRHETEVAAIQADINTWQAGFHNALQMLCTLRPNYTAQQILHQLGIPNDLIDF